MKIEISEKELAAIMAADYTLRKSREAKCGGTYFENVKDIENCKKISFYEAIFTLDSFLERVLRKGDDATTIVPKDSE